jgi:hypothetical protein
MVDAMMMRISVDEQDRTSEVGSFSGDTFQKCRKAATRSQ